MSLYTLSKSDEIGSMILPEGLRIEASKDVKLLSELSGMPVENINFRLANDNIAFVAYLNNQPAAFGWMAKYNAGIGELNHEFMLPEGNRYLWNFRTIDTYRGKGIYTALLHYILTSGDKNAARFWIIHAPENNASLKGIRKAGFKYVGKLYVDANNATTIEPGDLAMSLQNELTCMGIRLSRKPASSCWNCSSPFLKKRSNNCCCAEAKTECIGKRDLSTI